MIEVQREELLTLAQAARSLPGRKGKGIHVSTVWRWSLRGVRGVKLETVMVGGVRYCSREALQRFFEAATNSSNQTKKSSSTPTNRQKAITIAERELREAGI